MMKAAVRKQYGPPDTLKIEEVPKPTASANTVLVQVVATTINRTDCAILTGWPLIMRLFQGVLKPHRPIPGTDFAGIVVGIGSEVERFKVGDRVWGFHDEGLSSQAEYLVISENEHVDHMPREITFAEAAASLEGGHYAFNFLKKVKIRPGQHVLVNGATGAIGSALLQFLRYQKVSVTAVANTQNLDLIRSLGAEKLFDYLAEDFTLDNQRYDVVFDAVGKSTFGKCKRLLKPGGIYLSSELGPWSQNLWLALLTPIFGSRKVIFPIPTKIKESMIYIKKAIEDGVFRPVIDRSYNFQEIAEGYKYVASGMKTGNVVLDWKGREI